MAADLRPLCANRPGKATPPCILDAGHIQFELGAVDASFDRGVENYAIANLVARYGLTTTLEADIGWTLLTIVSANRESVSNTGDLVLALKQSFRNPDGSGFSLAVQPQLTVPTSGGAVAGGLLLPMALALSDKLGLSFTPEADLLPNVETGGSHFGGSAVIAAAVAVGAYSFGGQGLVEHRRRSDQPDLSGQCRFPHAVVDRQTRDRRARPELNLDVHLHELE